MPEFQPGDPQVPHGGAFAAPNVKQPLRTADHYRRFVEVNALGRHEIQRRGRRVEKPLARCVQFLEDVLNVPIRGMRLRGSVVADRLTKGQGTIWILTKNWHLHTAPAATVEGMHDGTARVFPSLHPIGSQRIRGIASQDSSFWIEIRIARAHLALAADEQLIEGFAFDLRLHDAAAIWLPLR
jgi:hypothetical protein